jgi:type IV secretory pathway VirB10-like protein
VNGINSDLPGQIIGQVAENIHDTATGRFILIPQGSKLIGDYDNAVTTGQERVLIAWTRIILPDASSIDLGKMPGADQSGLSGLHDKVNTHFWKMASSALMLSVLSAGVQISQGGQNPGNNGLNAQPERSRDHCLDRHGAPRRGVAKFGMAAGEPQSQRGDSDVEDCEKQEVTNRPAIRPGRDSARRTATVGAHPICVLAPRRPALSPDVPPTSADRRND